MPRPLGRTLRFLGVFAAGYGVLIALDQGLGLAQGILEPEAWIAHAISQRTENPAVTESIRVIDGDLVAKLWDKDKTFTIEGGLFSSNVMIWLALILATQGLRPRARIGLAMGGAAAIIVVNSLGLVAILRAAYARHPSLKLPMPGPTAAALYWMALKAYTGGIAQYVPVGILYLASVGGSVLRTLDAPAERTHARTRSKRHSRPRRRQTP